MSASCELFCMSMVAPVYDPAWCMAGVARGNGLMPIVAKISNDLPDPSGSTRTIAFDEIL